VTVESPSKADARRFYIQALNEAERAEFAAALDVEGVDGEIAALRLLLRTHLEDRPKDLPLMLRGLDVLRRMVATKYALSRSDSRDLANGAPALLSFLNQRGGGGGDDGGE
jgi:hypothetical protein